MKSKKGKKGKVKKGERSTRVQSDRSSLGSALPFPGLADRNRPLEVPLYIKRVQKEERVTPSLQRCVWGG